MTREQGETEGNTYKGEPLASLERCGQTSRDCAGKDEEEVEHGHALIGVELKVTPSVLKKQLGL
jgi:hypothetical protein